MGSGRGDRNQSTYAEDEPPSEWSLQWGPVVVTGIRMGQQAALTTRRALQWGPVVVTGIRWKGRW